MSRFQAHFALTLIVMLAACSGAGSSSSDPEPIAYFNVAVIVDTTSDSVTREQAEAVLALADASLYDLTAYSLRMVDFVEDDSNGSVEDVVNAYMAAHPGDLPNGILVFSVGDDDGAKINRGYAQQIPAPDDFRNPFVSPYLDGSYMYVAVLYFNYHYAACGYGGADDIQSPVSVGDECRGEEGTPCVEWEGMQICDFVLPILEERTPVDMAAQVVVHEFMHPFGSEGGGDHFGTEPCNAVMGLPEGTFNNGESDHYNGMCPNVYETFAASYQP
ncbi:MAG: hypothetical protein EPO32_02210 [Anaerolineae bacterium]|nr:MAG: hypothetical protein EPO32_02210 [Anaerolineae bacterium]